MNSNLTQFAGKANSINSDCTTDLRLGENQKNAVGKVFTVGVNKKVVGKCDPQKLSYAGAWQSANVTLEQLAEHIGKGHPWMPALLDGNGKRWQVNANRAEVLGVDIDSGLTIAEALEHPFITAHAGLLIESASSTAEHNKFRLVYRLAETLTDWQIIRICNRYLAEQVGHADPACKDASRFFFGAPGRKPILLNQEAVLPADFVAEAMAWHADLEAKWESERQAKLATFKGRQDLGDQVELARQALSYLPLYIPDNGTYPDLLRAACGCVNDLGAEGEALVRAWGGFGKKTDQKVASFGRTQSGRKAGLGSLFWYAAQYGFKPPELTTEQKRAYAAMMQAEREQAGKASGEVHSIARSVKAANRVIPLGQGEGSEQSYEQAIRELAENPPAEYSQKRFRWAEIAKIHGKQPLEVQKDFAALAQEIDQKLEQEDTRGEVADLIAAQNATLPDNVFPWQIAQYFRRQSELRGTSKEALILAGMPVIAARINARTTLSTKLSTSWGIHPRPWVAIVAFSGDGKNPTLDMWMDSVRRIQAEEDSAYAIEEAKYKKALRQWQADCKKSVEDAGDEPQAPAEYNFYVKTATLQGLADIACEQPDSGCVIYKPELTGLQNSFGAFSGGKSEDMDNFLDLRDGGSIRTRNSSKKRKAERTNFSVLGGIQPDKLIEQMGNLQDPQGFWARFWLVLIDTIIPDERESDDDVQEGRALQDLIYTVLLRVKSYPETTHRFTPDAMERLIAYREELNHRKMRESRLALRSTITKLKGYVAEVALILHLLDYAATGDAQPPIEIPIGTLDRAILVGEFTYAQRRLFQSRAEAKAADNPIRSALSTVQADILRLAKDKGQPVSARDCQRGTILRNNAKARPEAIRQMFVELAKAGYGVTQGEGSKLMFLAYGDKPAEKATGLEYDFEFSDD